MTATVSGAVIQPCCLGSIRIAAPTLLIVAQNGWVIRLGFAGKDRPFCAPGPADKASLAEGSHDRRRPRRSHPTVLGGIKPHESAYIS
jgi:hypothetical protein